MPLVMMTLIGMLTYEFQVSLPLFASETFHRGGGKGYALINASVAACDGDASVRGTRPAASATSVGRAGRTDIGAPRETHLCGAAGYFLSRKCLNWEAGELTVRQP